MAQILVVDDDEGCRSFIAETLELVQHEVTAVASGEEAFANLRRHSYDLLITDLKMPGAGGMALLKAARATCPYMSTIVITAFGTSELAVQAMKLGACDVVCKPVPSPQALQQLISRALRCSNLLPLR